MQRSSRVVTLPALAALMVIVAATAWALSREPPPLATCRLPDGTVLRLEAVTLGPLHRLVLGRYWQRLLAPLLPPAVRQRCRATVLTYVNANPPALVFWTSWNGPRSASIDWARAVVLDDQGGQFEAVGRAFQTGLSNAQRVRGWNVTAFPRRGRTVGLRLSIWDRPGHSTPAAEFTVPNPTPGPHPTWTGEPAPLTKRDGDLAFTLTHISTGSIRPEWLPERLIAEPWTVASFWVTERGKQSRDWAPIGMTISDATGNHVVPQVSRHQEADGVGQLAFYGRLLPDAEPWKLRVEFARTAHFAPEDLWTVRGLAVPGGRSTATTGRHGVKLDAILRAHGKQATDRLSFSVELPSPVNDVRLVLLQTTDEHGRVTCPEGEEALQFFPSRAEAHEQRLEIVSPDGASIQPERWCENWYRLRVFPDATRLDLTFAAAKSRFVEFLVRPHRR